MSNPQWAVSRELDGDQRRRLKDGTRTWTVYEHLTLTGTRSLVFDCGEAFRRLRTFPDDWDSLGDPALLALCHAPMSRLTLDGAAQAQSGDTAESS